PFATHANSPNIFLLMTPKAFASSVRPPLLSLASSANIAINSFSNLPSAFSSRNSSPAPSPLPTPAKFRKPPSPSTSTLSISSERNFAKSTQPMTSPHLRADLNHRHCARSYSLRSHRQPHSHSHSRSRPNPESA